MSRQGAPTAPGGAGGEATNPSAPPTTDSMNLTLAKAGTGTCRNTLNSAGKQGETEQEHPSKAASDGERRNASHWELPYTENRGGREQEVLESLSGEY